MLLLSSHHEAIAQHQHGVLITLPTSLISVSIMLPTCLLLLFSQVFLLLVTEMLIFLALIVPLPFTWRRKLFSFISESPIIAKLQYGMKVRYPNNPLLFARI